MLKIYLVIVFMGAPAAGEAPGYLKLESVALDKCQLAASQIMAAAEASTGGFVNINAYCETEKQ